MSSDFADSLGPPPRAGMIVIGAVTGFLAGQIVALLLELVGVHVTHFPGGLTVLGQMASPPWWSNALGLVGLWVGFAGAVWYATTRASLRLPASLWVIRVGDWKFVALGIAAQLAIDALYYPLHLRNLNKPVNHIFGGASGWTFWLLIVMTTLGAPLMEELLFRGVLYRALRASHVGRGGRATVVRAIIASAALFALAHAEPLQFVGLFALGVALAVVVERTHRITPSIVTHISFNAVAVVSLIAHRTGH